MESAFFGSSGGQRSDTRSEQSEEESGNEPTIAARSRLQSEEESGNEPTIAARSRLPPLMIAEVIGHSIAGSHPLMIAEVIGHSIEGFHMCMFPLMIAEVIGHSMKGSRDMLELTVANLLK